jgi:predicted N-acetyltransferase YhbS
MPPAKLDIALETERDAPMLSELSAQAFGPGRFARTAYRVREGVSPVASLCFTASAAGKLVGGIRFTAVRIGDETKALLLGPLVVDPAHTGNGYGKALIEQGIAKARVQGFRLVVLVGDLPYYGRFGFVAVPPGQIVLPGPVDPARLLALELAPGALSGAHGVLVATENG